MYYFYILLLEHLSAFIALLLAILCLLYLLFRRHVFSIFDPLLYYAVITEGFCIADVVFLYQFDLIEQKYLVNYLLTEAALFAGILQFKPVLPVPPPSELEPVPVSLWVAYQISLLLFVGFNLLLYSQRGIPLLAESRLEIYAVGGGWGLVGRSFDFLIIVIIYYLLEVRERRSWRPAEWLGFLGVLVIQVLSGAKSAILAVVFVAALHAFITGGSKRAGAESHRLLRGMAVAAVAGFIIVAAIQKYDMEVAGTEVPLLGQAAMRLVANGDALVLSYPNGFVEEIESSHPIGAVAKEYLAFFRVSSPEQLPDHIGVQISRAFGGRDMTQTNAKHNLFGYVYFGAVGAIVFSFMVGTCIGAARYRLLRMTSRRWIWAVAYILVNVAFSAAASEWDGVSRSVIAVLIFVLPVALLPKIIEPQDRGFRAAAPIARE